MHVDKALDAAIRWAGSRRRLAAKLGVSHQAIGQWTKIPASRIIEIEQITGIPREELRPDLYRRRGNGSR